MNTQNKVLSLAQRYWLFLLAPMSIFVIRNFLKASIWSLYGVPANFDLSYHSVSIETLFAQLEKIAYSDTILIMSIWLPLAIIFLLGIVGVYLLQKTKDRPLSKANRLGLFLFAFLVKPFITVGLMVLSTILYGKLYWNLGDEMILSRYLGLNDWVLPILLCMLSLLIWNFTRLKKTENVAKFHVTYLFTLILGFYLYISWV